MTAYFAYEKTLTRRSRRIIRRANETRIFFDIRYDFGFVENVIAGSHHVKTTLEKLIGERGRDGKTARHVFAVHQSDVNFIFFAQASDSVQNRQPAWSRHDIGDN